MFVICDALWMSITVKQFLTRTKITR